MHLSDPGLQLAHDQLPCGWLRLDAQARVSAVNRPFADLMGLEAEALIGTAFDRLLTLPSRVLFQSYLHPLLQLSGRIAEIAVSLRPEREDAPRLDCLLYASPCIEDPTQRDLVVVPILERRRIEEELQRVRRAADLAPGMIFQLLRSASGEWRFAYVSQAVGRLYGLTEAQACNDAQRLLGRLDPDDRRQLLLALETAGQEDRSCQIRVTMRHPESGARRVHEWHAEPKFIGGGETAWHGYAADITERRVVEEAEAQRVEAQRELRRRSNFLARASHELRTPLNAILGFAQLLNADDAALDTAESRRQLALIEASGRHMLALVNQLIGLAKLDHVDEQLDCAPQPLHEVVQAALDAAGPAAAAAQVQLHSAVLQDLVVSANALALRQLLDNLLSNAIKFNRPGGRVNVHARGSSSRVQLTVADTGRGLTAEQQNQLFEPFNRLGAPGGLSAGAGLGLVICRQLARHMGAELWLDSTAGVGTQAHLDLARCEPAPALPPASAEPLQAVAGSEAATEVQVLHVEDDEINVVVMEAILARRPELRVQTARSATEALAAVQGTRFALLLCDLHLPDGDGIALLAQLRAAGLPAQTPALLVTATVADDVHQAALRAGFAEVLSKPVVVTQVLERVKACLLHTPPAGAPH